MEPTASRPAPASPAPDVEALAAFLDCDADLDALERSLLAAAVHPEGGGGETAWLARWNARRGGLEGWLVEEPPVEPLALSAAIGRARRAPPLESAAADRARAWAADVDALEGVCAQAWRTGEPALGPGGEQPGAPWSASERVGVIALRRGARPYGLLVVALAERAGEPSARSRWYSAAAASYLRCVRRSEMRAVDEASHCMARSVSACTSPTRPRARAVLSWMPITAQAFGMRAARSRTTPSASST